MAAAGVLSVRASRFIPEDARRWGIAAFAVMGAGLVLLAVQRRLR